MLAVVGNLPVVPPEKHEKLTGVIKKIYSQIGHIREGARHSAAAPPLSGRSGRLRVSY